MSAPSLSRIQQQLLAASPGTRLVFGSVNVRVHAYGFEAFGALEREWSYGDAMARERIAGRVAEAVATRMNDPIPVTAS